MAASWQAMRSAMESAWPRRIATSAAESLRGGSGRRARPGISAGLSAAKVTSSSGWRAMAFRQEATERLSGSVGASFCWPGLRLEIVIASSS